MFKMSASEIIDILYKMAEEEYLKPIKCEVCGYEGKPEYDGRCPNCGAIGGVKPHDPSTDKPYEGLQDNQLKQINLDMMAQNGDSDSIYW